MWDPPPCSITATSLPPGQRYKPPDRYPAPSATLTWSPYTPGKLNACSPSPPLRGFVLSYRLLRGRSMGIQTGIQPLSCCHAAAGNCWSHTMGGAPAGTRLYSFRCSADGNSEGIFLAKFSKK